MTAPSEAQADPTVIEGEPQAHDDTTQEGSSTISLDGASGGGSGSQGSPQPSSPPGEPAGTPPQQQPAPIVGEPYSPPPGQ
jgi:hypothetical protein